MSRLLVLPAALPSSSFTLGQLVTNPLDANTESLKPTVVHTQSKHEEILSDEEAGIAEKLSHITIDKPSAVFNSLRSDHTARFFMRNMTSLNKPVYFVTGLQTLQESVSKRAVVEDGLVAEAKTQQFRLPVRRVDSANSLDGKSKHPSGSIVAVELLKVKCIVGPSSVPHTLQDLDYQWSYHSLDDEDEDVQLSVGLGKPLRADELRSLAGIADEEEEEEEEERGRRWVSYYSESEDGIGGF